MRKIREILRLLWCCGLRVRATARACDVSHSTVLEYRRRAEEAELVWEDVEKLEQADLEQRLFPESAKAPSRPLPVWSEIHQELKRPGVTLQLLWEEYKAEHREDGYQYSRFCELYGEWRGRLSLSMRQTHKAGEKLFVDYCGQTVPIQDPSTGELRKAQIFVAVLGASNYTYAEATWSQSLSDWTGSHVRTLEHLGGVPELVVPDNLKSGVSRACRYEPELNPTYRDLAMHYGTAVVPARVRKPKDKSKVEGGVLVVERWILARLRHRQFFSLHELNAEVSDLLVRLNERPFKKLPGTRRTQFEALDKPALKALPSTRFEYADWHKVRPGADYHVEVERHHYSVPYQLVGKELEARVSASSVEVLHGGHRVACHVRSSVAGGHTTLLEHMPPSHRGHAEQTPQKLLSWAEQTGESTCEVVSTILVSKPHPQQGFNSCLGLKNLSRRYGPERLEAACTRALEIGGLSYKSIRSILQSGLDRAPPQKATRSRRIEHQNVRGASYYQSEHPTETTEELSTC
jgi:transposase